MPSEILKKGLRLERVTRFGGFVATRWAVLRIGNRVMIAEHLRVAVFAILTVRSTVTAEAR